MRVALIGSPTSWHADDLRRATAGSHTIEAFPFDQLQAKVAGDASSVAAHETTLNPFDGVLVRSMPPGSLEQVVFRMNALAVLAGAGVPVLNPPRAVEVAVDKYLATARLRDAGLLTPATYACQTAAAACEAFDQLGGRAVMKPVFGGEGRGVTRLDDRPTAERAFRLLEQLGSVVLLQEFIEPLSRDGGGNDFRLLVVGDEVLGMKRVNPGDWRANISRGARAEPLEVTDELATLARRSADAVGAPLAGVDLLPARDGRLYALEVNAVPGWRALAGVTGADVAARVLDLLQKQTSR